MFPETKLLSKWLPAYANHTAHALRPTTIVKQCLLSKFSRENDYKRMTDFGPFIFDDGCVKHLPAADHSRSIYII